MKAFTFNLLKYLEGVFLEKSSGAAELVRFLFPSAATGFLAGIKRRKLCTAVATITENIRKLNSLQTLQKLSFHQEQIQGKDVNKTVEIYCLFGQSAITNPTR